jgi:hypothetical protein
VAYLNHNQSAGLLRDWEKSNLNGPRRTYGYSNIQIKEISTSGSNTRDDIKSAIDGETPVMFSYRFYSKNSWPRSSFDEFWYNNEEEDVFTNIGTDNNTSEIVGHAMCITGADNHRGSGVDYFFVQNSWGACPKLVFDKYDSDNNPVYKTIYNRPFGTLKIPQNLNYAQKTGGQPRYRFYRLGATWRTLLPVEIYDLWIDFSADDDIIVIQPAAVNPPIGGPITNSFTVPVENNVPIAGASARMSLNGGAPFNAPIVFQSTGDGACTYTYSHTFTRTTSVPRGTYTLTVVDAAGKTYGRSFNFSVSRGWAALLP